MFFLKRREFSERKNNVGIFGEWIEIMKGNTKNSISLNASFVKTHIGKIKDGDLEAFLLVLRSN